MTNNDLKKLYDFRDDTPGMPVLFLGHGSPMNAIEENIFVKGFRQVASEIALPRAILCISAHWVTGGTKVTSMENPPTIHDFGGFPNELHEIEYPAPGSTELAQETKGLVKSTDVYLDDAWGLDHGAWTVLRHMYPNADIPTLQLSLDKRKGPRQHYELAKDLAKLRDKGVLIVGSGNLIHNLQRLAWGRLNEVFAYDWAREAGGRMNKFILDGDHESLINYSKQGKEFRMSIPTPEHFLPLLYILALQGKNDGVILFNDKPVGGSLTMTSVRIG